MAITGSHNTFAATVQTNKRRIYHDVHRASKETDRAVKSVRRGGKQPVQWIHSNTSDVLVAEWALRTSTN